MSGLDVTLFPEVDFVGAHIHVAAVEVAAQNHAAIEGYEDPYPNPFLVEKRRGEGEDRTPSQRKHGGVRAVYRGEETTPENQPPASGGSPTPVSTASDTGAAVYDRRKP